MGIGYIMFAKNEKHLFRMLFLSEKRGSKGNARKRFREYVLGALMNALSGFEPLEGFSEDQKMGLIGRMWIFLPRAACMLLNNSIIDDIDEKQVSELLLDMGIFVIRGERARKKIYEHSDVQRFLTLSGFGYLAQQKVSASNCSEKSVVYENKKR